MQIKNIGIALIILSFACLAVSFSILNPSHAEFEAQKHGYTEYEVRAYYEELAGGDPAKIIAQGMREEQEKKENAAISFSLFLMFFVTGSILVGVGVVAEKVERLLPKDPPIPQDKPVAEMTQKEMWQEVERKAEEKQDNKEA